eukprot:12726799-Ditylum_brightwellii.AAC.1
MPFRLATMRETGACATPPLSKRLSMPPCLMCHRRSMSFHPSRSEPSLSRCSTLAHTHPSATAACPAW